MAQAARARLTRDRHLQVAQRLARRRQQRFLGLDDRVARIDQGQHPRARGAQKRGPPLEAGLFVSVLPARVEVAAGARRADPARR